ncbi:hypothetical protein Tco_0837737 [Tanacetum coccineum]
MAGSDDDIPPPPPPQIQTPTQQAPYTFSTIKLPILKKGEYDIWAMKMEHYLAHTDYPIWEVIQRGNGPIKVGVEGIEIMDREVKQLNQSQIPIVKVRRYSIRGPEYTWEREDQMWKKYPHLFDFNKKRATR